MRDHPRLIQSVIAVLSLTCMVLVPSLFSGDIASLAGSLPPDVTAAPGPGTPPPPSPPIQTTPTATATPTPPPEQIYYQYLPHIAGVGLPEVELLDTWTSDAEDGLERNAFLPGMELVYHADGRNNLNTPLSVGLRMDQSGPCDAGLIFSDTLTVLPGDFQHSVPANTLDCTGVYTTTTSLTYLTVNSQTVTTTLMTRHVVNLTSTVIISEGQGFDRCYAPSIEQMQTWWDSSPYSVFNLYVGGISFACKDRPLDPIWVHRVARQGWSFIMTWVGPQAPCTSFQHRMSWDPMVAYWQGRGEAASAIYEADRLGFFGGQVIYYDIEAYPSSPPSCRDAVNAFLVGWVEQLHEAGLKAGGYGGACNSYISEWASNDPPPDDVWIAHWYTNEYDPEATVWDAPCVSNDLWTDHQRIKQYTGGHSENWGGVSLTIDSNVLDGEITALGGVTPTLSTSAPPVILSTTGSQVRDFGLVGADGGWAHSGDRLLYTDDGGAHWREITPEAFRVLGVAFASPVDAWVVGWRDPDGGLGVARSRDGGLTWQIQPLPYHSHDIVVPFEAVFIEPLDERTAWVVLKLHSGSNFSLGRMFATRDGGLTWVELEVPLGEAVEFLDARRGWIGGGPRGDQLYMTEDGGRSWQQQPLVGFSGGTREIGLPYFFNELEGFIPVVWQGPGGSMIARYATRDGGLSWRLESRMGLDSALSVGKPSILAPALRGEVPIDRLRVIPHGTVSVDFFDDQQAWALVHVGDCQGSKGATERGVVPDDVSMRCQQQWMLLATDDGGRSWHEISP